MIVCLLPVFLYVLCMTLFPNFFHCVLSLCVLEAVLFGMLLWVFVIVSFLSPSISLECLCFCSWVNKSTNSLNLSSFCGWMTLCASGHCHSYLVASSIVVFCQCTVMLPCTHGPLSSPWHCYSWPHGYKRNICAVIYVFT